MSETAGLAMSGFGAGYSAMGSLQAGKYAKEVGQYNSSVANLQSDDAMARGETALRRQRGLTRQLVGAQRASFAAQGQDPNDFDSSAGDVQQDAAYLSELDIATIRNNAAREAWGYRVQAKNESMRGSIAYTEGVNKATGTILGTAADLTLRKYGMKRVPPS